MQQQVYEVIPVPTSDTLTLAPTMDTVTALAKLSQFQEFIANYLKEGDDFGTIPGTNKPTLYKPGAEKLCELYGFFGDFEINQRVEDWDRKPELFDYEIKCILKSKRDQSIVAVGFGSCNSYEARYRYRDSQRMCPNCNEPTIIKGKAEYGGGFVCWAKGGAGCKSKFKEDDPAITEQVIGRIDNKDIPSLKNTILKMATKRAYVDATLKATRSSAIFTQDMEDFAVDVVTVKQVKDKKEELKHGSVDFPQKSDLGTSGFSDLLTEIAAIVPTDLMNVAIIALGDLFGLDLQKATPNKALKTILEKKFSVFFDAKTQSVSGLTIEIYTELQKAMNQVVSDLQKIEAEIS